MESRWRAGTGSLPADTGERCMGRTHPTSVPGVLPVSLVHAAAAPSFRVTMCGAEGETAGETTCLECRELATERALGVRWWHQSGYCVASLRGDWYGMAANETMRPCPRCVARGVIEGPEES